MSLKLYIGSSGSGKSYKMYTSIINSAIDNPKNNYIIIVPEQFTMETQRDIVTLHPCRGTLNIDIVSFNRLAFRVFQELHIKTKKVIEDLGKTMIIRRIISEHKNELKLFGYCIDKIGFIDEVKSFLSEIYQYNVRVEDIEAVIDHIDESDIINDKLYDISIIYKAFVEYIKDNYVVSEEILDILGQHLNQSEIVAHSTICFDGFTGFTPIQYKLIGELMKVAQDIKIAITIDPDSYYKVDVKEHELFALSKKTISKLIRLCKENRIEVDTPDICDSVNIARFMGNGAMLHFEKNIFRYPYNVYNEEQDSVHLIVLRDRRSEAYYVARKIRYLVEKNGYQYKDIAVVSGNLEECSIYYPEVMDSFHIPYYVDTNTSINNNLCIETLRAIINMIIKDFSYETVFRYMKSQMTNISQEEVEVLENHVIKYGIRGYSTYTKKWEQENVDKIRSTFIEEISDIYKVFQNHYLLGREYIEGLYSFCVHLQMEQKLIKEVEIFDEKKDYVQSKIYSQIYEKVITIFDKIIEILGDSSLTPEEFLEILEVGFDTIDLGTIPPSLDQVIVGDIERTRLNHIKILFFIGVNDGVVPKGGSDTGILTDEDKNQLLTYGLALAPTNRENAYIEQLYLYLNMTKPEEQLYISYVQVDSEGKSLRPSYIVNRIKNIFSCLKEEYLDDVNKVEDIYTMADGISILTKEFQDYIDNNSSMKHGSRELYEACKNFKNTHEIWDLREGMRYSYQTQNLRSDIAKELYGEIIRGSVSKMENYANCPFAFFMKYGLGIKERDKYEVETSNIGSILHRTIEKVFAYVYDTSDLEWTTITDLQRDDLVDRFLLDSAREENSTIFESSARKKYLLEKMNKIARRTAKTLQHHINSGDMIPTYFEKKFSEEDKLSSTRICLEDNCFMQFNGVIDRIDVFEDEENVYVKIIDYKSGDKDFDVNKFYNGLQLQLVTYMEVVLELIAKEHPNKKIIPAGMFYYHMYNPIVEAQDELEANTKINKELKLKGLVNIDDNCIDIIDKDKKNVLPISVDKDNQIKSTSSTIGEDQIYYLNKFANSKLKEMGNNIIKGKIPIEPVKNEGAVPCTYCEYSSICQFDEKTPEGYRYIKKEKPEEVWKAMMKQEEVDEVD